MIVIIIGLCGVILLAQLRARRWRKDYERASRQRDDALRVASDAHNSTMRACVRLVKAEEERAAVLNAVRVALGVLQDPALILQTRTHSEWVECAKWEYRLYHAIIKAMGFMQEAHDSAVCPTEEEAGQKEELPRARTTKEG